LYNNVKYIIVIIAILASFLVFLFRTRSRKAFLLFHGMDLYLFPFSWSISLLFYTVMIPSLFSWNKYWNLHLFLVFTDSIYWL